METTFQTSKLLKQLSEPLNNLVTTSRLALHNTFHYDSIDQVMYRVFMNELWARRDAELGRLAISAMELDESMFNAIDALLLCLGYKLTNKGENQLYEVIATTEIDDFQTIIEAFSATNPDIVDEYYSFKKDLDYDISYEKLTARLNSLEAFTAKLENMFCEIFKNEIEQENKEVLEITLKHPANLG